MQIPFEAITQIPLAHGADNACIIDAAQIELDRVFRDMCAANACGVYGKCWMCPPDVGDIDTLMAEIRQYDYALVYQTISPLEDSYDVERMSRARAESHRLAQKIRAAFSDLPIARALHLGAGGCGVCKTCAKRTNEPCHHPDLAMASLEAYGINVSRMAAAAGMKYINGQNTVTYFGAVLFGEKGEGIHG